MSVENFEDKKMGGMTELEKLSASTGALDIPQLNSSIDGYGRNLREFGLQECIEAAKGIFTPEVLDNWASLSPEQRSELAQQYGDRVAQSFQLVNYNGVVFEPMEGANGYNNGDGHAYLSDTLIKEQRSPLQLIDTITHELRHQYQSECVEGLHLVPDETRMEWAKATLMYTTQMPWAEDPWGYKYNPLELDARYAGESVVREMTKDYMNGNYA